MTFEPPAPSRGWNIGLWVAQVALAALYLMAAWMHGTLSPEAMAQMGATWALGAPIALVRFIGLVEFLGVLGLILPAATRIQPRLTVLAALGLLAIQVLAVPFHILRAEWAALPFNVLYIGLSLLVLWGRSRKAPITAR